MPVSLEDVRKVAELARLKFGPKEEQQLVEDLNKMLGYVALLSEIDTSGVAPTTHVISIKNVFREDKLGQCLNQEDVLFNAPSFGQGHFRVPKVIE